MMENNIGRRLTGMAKANIFGLRGCVGGRWTFTIVSFLPRMIVNGVMTIPAVWSFISPEGVSGEVVLELEVEGVSGVVGVVAEEEAVAAVYEHARESVYQRTILVEERLLCKFDAALDVHKG
jgi:hypothetical protein